MARLEIHLEGRVRVKITMVSSHIISQTIGWVYVRLRPAAVPTFQAANPQSLALGDAKTPHPRM